MLTVVFLVPRIPFNFQPQSDGGLLYVSLHMPPGTSDEIENSYVGKIEDAILKKKEVRTVQTLIYSGQADADLTIQLVPIQDRQNVFLLAPEWRKELLPLIADQPSARLFVNTARYGGNAGGFGGGTAEILFTSPNFDQLKNTIPLIRKEIEKNPYAVDVTTSLDYLTFQRNFVPNQDALKGTGITTSQIAAAFETYATGLQASTLVKGGLSYPIYVMADPILLHGAQSLLDLRVYSPTLQTSLSMRQLGTFQLTESPLSITRHDRLYSATVDVDLTPNAPPALAFQNMVQADLTKAGLVGQGVNVSSNGAFSPAALAAQLSTLLPMSFGLAIFLVYLVMASQFNSWKYPVYLLLPVPLALIGALFAVYLFGGGMDLFAMLGLLMLIGLSAKNAIIYLEFVMERIGKMPLADALIEAAHLRFRPIIMTTLTVLMISFPLMFATGQGAEFGQKVGVVMLGGVLTSAILTFFVVPAAFYRFERQHTSAKDLEAVTISTE
ncbi:MAG: efflux RND transporter permease subunit [Spirochaetales bacterium]|nr:efflux RND transporter permease subunit [Spirochaetales bacterium]